LKQPKGIFTFFQHSGFSAAPYHKTNQVLLGKILVGKALLLIVKLAQDVLLIPVRLKVVMEQNASQNVNNCLNTNIYSYLETSVACTINKWQS
jgi:hypothetical protein